MKSLVNRGRNRTVYFDQLVINARQAHSCRHWAWLSRIYLQSYPQILWVVLRGSDFSDIVNKLGRQKNSYAN